MVEFSLLVMQTVNVVMSIYILNICISNLSKRQFNATVIYYPVFFSFFPLNILLDFFFGVPNYKWSLSLLQKPYSDITVNVIYNIFLFGMNSLFLFSVKRLLSSFSLIRINFRMSFRYILWGVVFLGPLSLFFVSEPSVYITYGAVRDYIGEDVYDEHGVVWLFSFFSVISITVLRLSYGKKISATISFALILILFVDIYINNKRFILSFIVIYSLIGYFYSFNNLKSKMNVVFSVFLMAASYNYYSYNVKYEYEQSDSEVYSNTRLELSRDDVFKYAISERILNGNKILEYTGQSYVFTFFAFVPREYWPDKPYAYGQYISNKVISDRLGPRLSTWTITTSLYDEAIANFSYLGFLFIFVFIYTFLRVIDYERNTLLKFAYILFLFFYTLTNINWFLPMLYALIFIFFYRKIRLLLFLVSKSNVIK